MESSLYKEEQREVESIRSELFFYILEVRKSKREEKRIRSEVFYILEVSSSVPVLIFPAISLMVRMVCRLTEESEHTAAIAPIRCRFCCVLTSLPVGSLYLSSPSRKHSTSTDGKRQRSCCKTSVDGKGVYGVDIFSLWREGHACLGFTFFTFYVLHLSRLFYLVSVRTVRCLIWPGYP
ncbi:hypothetical protein BHE74_00059080 [Ensete ventricosum]|nr:hypothetical protein BHE74_00059080 [Ensete ventricosum]